MARYSKIERQKVVVERMIKLYCVVHHPTADKAYDSVWHHISHYKQSMVLCEVCQALVDYSHIRLDRCRYGEQKSSCQKCATHCYSPLMRQKIREVMRWSGPRMLIYAPASSLDHMVSDLKHAITNFLGK